MIPGSTGILHHMTERIEITVSDEMFARLEAARGHEPRASFIKRALETALEAAPQYARKPIAAKNFETPAAAPTIPESPRLDKGTFTPRPKGKK